MQITPTVNEGLKREFRIVVAARDIDESVMAKLTALGQQVRIPGFRPGKAPVALLRKQYGRAVLGEVLEETVSRATDQAIREHELRPAVQPRIEVTKFAEGTDLEYTMAVEVLPSIDPGDFRKIKLERLVSQVAEGDLDAALERLAQQHRSFTPIAPPRPAQKGDVVKVDFVGAIGGAAFAGGSAEDAMIELGAGSFIPGFEDQLVGATVGDKVEVNVTFPADYGNKELAGKAARFDVTVKELNESIPAAIDDDLAKKLGLMTLAELRTAARQRMETELKQWSRARLKRALLDALSEIHTFPVPPGMMEQEFEQIWQQVQSDPAAAEELKSGGKSEDAVKAEYRAIAERRVRLGLLLAEVGRRNNIEVKPEEVNRAMIEEARRFPGQERQVIEFFRKKPEALARLRAPIFEDKTVDYILEMADVSEREVPREELMRDPGSPLAPDTAGAA
jgi:trigger factor